MSTHSSSFWKLSALLFAFVSCFAAAGQADQKCKIGKGYGNSCVIATFPVEQKVLDNQKNIGGAAPAYGANPSMIYTLGCHPKTKGCDTCPATGSTPAGFLACKVKAMPALPNFPNIGKLLRTEFHGAGQPGYVSLPSFDRIDPWGLAEGASVPTEDLNQAMNDTLKDAWKSGAGDAEKAIKDAICDAIQVLDNNSSELYSCSRGSSASAELGTAAPKVKVTDATVLSVSETVVKTKVKFRGSWSSSGALIKATVKCKVKVGIDFGPFGKAKLGTSDGACPDGHASSSKLAASLTGSAVLVSRPGGKTTIEDVKPDQSNADAELKVCFNFVIAGQKCFQLGNKLDNILDKQFRKVVEKGLQRL